MKVSAVLVMGLIASSVIGMSSNAYAFEQRSARAEIFQNGDRDTRECEWRKAKRLREEAAAKAAAPQSGGKANAQGLL